MKLVNISAKSFNPKKLFGSRKDRSTASRSKPTSFGSGSSSTSPFPEHFETPTSVLTKASGDWSDYSSHTALVHSFKLIDRDNDGVVSRKELEALLSRIGPEEEVTMMLSEVDRSGDGCISLDVLMYEFGSACSPACVSELRETFEFFDTDHDGKITPEELFSVFTAIGDDRCTLDDCRQMIAGVDKNGDGFVCFEDFSRMMELRL